MKSARKESPTDTLETPDLEPLIDALAEDDGEERQRARTELVALGEAAVPALTAALYSSEKIVRWEAAKTLTELRSPVAAMALVETLEDESSDVRWLAAEALIGIGRPALAPLLRALAHRGSSARLRDGAHHVLRDLALPELAETLAPVLEALRGGGSRAAAAPAAERALARLQEEPPR